MSITKRRGRLAALLLIAALAFGCAGISTRSLVPFGAANHSTAFLGVEFGEPLEAVQRRYPDGTLETSPFGAPAYRLQNMSAGAVDYQSVIYEFTDKNGMQLVYATFAPSWSGDVYRQLQQILGTPLKTNGETDPSRVEASWQGKGGALLSYDGPEHCLAIVGPNGNPLRADIALREEP